jgi:hypothetical protein
VDVHRAKIYCRITAVIGENLHGPFDIDAEFCLLLAGSQKGVSFIIDVGVDTQGGFWPFAFSFGQANQVFQLRFRFDVEIADAGV